MYNPSCTWSSNHFFSKTAHYAKDRYMTKTTDLIKICLYSVWCTFDEMQGEKFACLRRQQESFRSHISAAVVLTTAVVQLSHADRTDHLQFLTLTVVHFISVHVSHSGTHMTSTTGSHITVSLSFLSSHCYLTSSLFITFLFTFS
jgi:hypothetical protein